MEQQFETQISINGTTLRQGVLDALSPLVGLLMRKDLSATERAWLKKTLAGLSTMVLSD